MSLVSRLQRLFDATPAAKVALRPLVRAGYAGYFKARARIEQTLDAAGWPLLRHRLLAMRRGVPVMEAAFAQPAGHVGRAATGRSVVMIVVSDLRIEPRVEREARALAASGYAVTVLCPLVSEGLDLSAIDWGPGVTIVNLPWASGRFAYGRPGYLGHDLYLAALHYRPFAFHGHDLNTCYVALAAAKVTGAHMIADFHEWTSENVHWDEGVGRNVPFEGDWKADLQSLERLLMREASAVITVSQAIVDALASELGGGRKAALVRNIPTFAAAPTRDYPPLKEQLGLPADRFVLLWQGGTGPTRMIEPVIEALVHAPACTFVIRGPSLDLFGNGYRDLARRLGVSDRLVLRDGVPSRDVVAAARGADAGIWTLPALCRNFTFALPNKIFEYTAAGLPVLVADYPEARRVVEEHGIGLAFDPYDPRSIAAAINRLVEDRAFAEACRARTEAALAAMDARAEWAKVVAIYDDLASRARTAA